MSATIIEVNTLRPQPDQNGEFASPVDGALFMASFGIPQTPLSGKKPILKDWPEHASADPDQIMKWATEHPGCNFGSVAKEGEFFVFEADGPGPRERFEATGNVFTSKLVVVSRAGRGHRWYRYAPGVSNISQKNKFGDFSLRALNEQCVSPGSFHPETGKQYVVGFGFSEPTAPTQAEIDFWNSQRSEPSANPAQDIPLDANNLIPDGYKHGWLVSQAGRLRSIGLGGDALETALITLAEEKCAQPLDLNKVRQVARSFEKYPKGQSGELLMADPAVPAAPAAPEVDTSESAMLPVFPYWVLEGTSIYEGLVAPAIATSSKHAEFIAMPAIQTMLNHLSQRVRVGSLSQHSNFNLFVGLISPYGQFFKSSSCTLALSYFAHMGLLQVDRGSGITNVEGKIVVASAGSPEGFGLRMQKINAKHSILFNDELGKFVSKAGIESSSFSSDLLSWYEAGFFGNTVTNDRKHFSFDKDYAFGWLWCTTDRGFNRHWPKLAGMSSGLEDRMFYVVSPKNPKPTVTYRDPMFQEAAVKTRRLIDKAVAQGTYEFENTAAYEARVAGMDPRSMAMVEKFALYFAVDTDSQAIDDDHVERALALVEYRNAAAAYLAPIEADNQQGRLQKEITRELRQHNGKLRYRELCRNLDFERYGLDVWNRAYDTMVRAGILFEFQEQITPGKRATRMVGLAKEED